MTNSELNELGLSTVTRNVDLLPMVSVPHGKGVKQIQRFASGSAKDVKAMLKSQNPELKGKALSKAINAVLTGEKSLREQLGVAFVQACIQNGKVPDRGEVTKNGAKLIFVNAAAVEIPVPVETDYEALSVDEVAALLHKLEAILDVKVAQNESVDVENNTNS